MSNLLFYCTFYSLKAVKDEETSSVRRTPCKNIRLKKIGKEGEDEADRALFWSWKFCP